MECNTIVFDYQKVNHSFKKILIYHIGIDAGFFSEYSSMINLMLYCLKNQIQFKLYSQDANFGYENGWTDYFKPFCEEVHDSIHHRYNFHSRQPLRRIWKYRKEVEAPTIRWKVKLEILHMLGKICKYTKKFDYYTQDLSDKFEYKADYFIPDMNLAGSYVDMFRYLDSVVWHFSEEIEMQVEKYLQTLKMPPNYIACQIRGGDKNIEYNLYSTDMYIDKLKSMRDVRDVFVLTDDFSIMEELYKKAPTYNWYTLCQPSERGYYNRTFSEIKSDSKKEQMIRFFASIEILKKSSSFLGTISSAPSCYIANLKYPNVSFVDIDSINYPDIIKLNFIERREIVQNYLDKKLL